MDSHYPWRRGPGRLRWHPDGTDGEGYSIVGAAEYSDLLDLLMETRPFEIGSWLDRRYVDKWVIAAALRALKEDCPRHPYPANDPGCPRCVHDTVLERCARMLTGEQAPHSPARPELQPDSAESSEAHDVPGPEPRAQSDRRSRIRRWAATGTTASSFAPSGWARPTGS